MRKKTNTYVAPDIDGWELELAGIMCQSQFEDIVSDDTDGIDF